MTRDIPILCRGPEVRAILEGRKTQMRRALKPQPDAGPGGQMVDLGGGEYGLLDGDLSGRWKLRWQPGDRLWVKETWAGASIYDHMSPTELNDQDVMPLWYKAGPPESDIPPPGRWRSPIHMPRWASRITLLVTDVRVQRVQDISERDAEAEGAPAILVPPNGGSAPHIEGFREVWTTINGPGSWDANPWVAAISFERMT